VCGVGAGVTQGGRDAKSIVDYGLQQVKKLVGARQSGKGGGGSKGEKSGKNQNQVVELSAADFDQKVLQSDDYWLVEFFAPWCVLAHTIPLGFGKPPPARSDLEVSVG
jgi:hypothetical protein